MRAMILGAGLGTRLRPLTDRLAKPAVPFFDRALAGHVLRHLVAVGATDIVVNVHHLPETLEAALRPWVPDGVTLEIVREPVLLGTGGGVRHALMRQSARLGPPGDEEPIVLANGDVAFAPDLHAALARHRASSALATLVVRRDPGAERMGAVHVAGGMVARILGPSDPSTEPFQFTGVHVLSGRALAFLPEEGCIVRRGYIPLLGAGERLAAHVESAPFRDCGTVAEYLAAHRDVLAGRVTLPIALTNGGFVDGEAQVEGAVLVESVVGARARVAPGVTLRRCVVWPGTVVSESFEDAVLADELAVRA